MTAPSPSHPTMSTPIILLPIDGSPSALRAAKFCTDVAKAFKASVVLLNVQPVIEDWQTHGLGHDAALAHLNDSLAAAPPVAAKVDPASLFPAQPSGYVTDVANLLDAETAAAIEVRLDSLQRLSGAEVVVVTLATIGEQSLQSVATAPKRRAKVRQVSIAILISLSPIV